MKFTGAKVFDTDINTVTTDPIKPSKFKPKEGVNINMDNFSYSNLDELVYENYGKASDRLIPVGSTGVGESKYDEGITLSQLVDLEGYRASKQPVSAQAFNAIVGGIGSGLVGVGENFSVLADAVGNKLGMMEDFEKSTITENLQGAKDWINELTPIYRKDRGDSFDWSDSGFYFEMLKGAVDSAVAFGLAGAGYAGIMRNLASTLGKATLAGQRLNVLTRFAGSKLGNPAIAQDLTQLGAAALSNYGEGTVMGLETYESEKEKLIDVGMRTKVNQLAEAQGIDPSEVVLSEDELDEIEGYAIKEAGKAGHMMRNLNHMLLFSNLAQMRSIAGLRNAITGGGSTLTRNMLQRPGMKQFWKNQAIGAPLESAEEIGQNVIQMESKYQSELRAQEQGLQFKPEELTSTEGSLGQRIIDFATSDQALLEGMMGFISGPIQYGITQAPFQKGYAAEQAKRYATQQTIIGSNADFITNKLKQTANGEALAKEFETFRDEVLGRDPSQDTPELRAEDAKKFEELIKNTQLDTLIQENLFNGTTQDLEDKLKEEANKEATTEEEKLVVDNAKSALERLNKLESTFINYNKYINGAEIFAADLRGQRLGQISEQLESSFANREKQMTMDIQAALEAEYVKLFGTQFDGELSSLNKNFILKSVDKDGKVVKDSDKEVSSVTDIVNGIASGYQLFNSSTGAKVLAELDSVNKAVNNKLLLDNVKTLQRQNRLFVNEAKSKDYQSLYANYVDAMQSTDENNVNEMGLVKSNLQEILKDKRFEPKYTFKETDTEGNSKIIDLKFDKNTTEEAKQRIITAKNAKASQPFSQLKTSIENQITDLDRKIAQIEATENSVEEEVKNEVKTKSKEAASNNKKGTSPTLEAQLAGGAGTETPTQETETSTETTSTTEPKPKYYPILAPELLEGFQKPMEERGEKFKQVKFINPDTGQADTIASARVSPTNAALTEVSFSSNPTKFHKFQEEDVRYIPSQKEVYQESQQTQAEVLQKEPDTQIGKEIEYNGEKGWIVKEVLPDGKIKANKGNKTVIIDPKQKQLQYKKGDKIDYNGEKGFIVQQVLPDGKLKIKKDNRVITVNPNKITSTVDKIVPKTTTQQATTKTTTTSAPANQIDNKKDTQKAPVNKANVDLATIEPKAIDNAASVKSMKIQVESQDTIEDTNEVDVIPVGVNETTGEIVYESANVKTLDYNFNDTNQDEFYKFVRNKQNKDGVVVSMSVDTSDTPLRLFKKKATEVKKAIEIFNKLKSSGLKNLKDWNTVITEEEYKTLINYLPVKFNVKEKPSISSHMQVLDKLALKTAERILRTDTINAALNNLPLERKIKGQGPGRLNEIAPTKVNDFLNSDEKVNNAVLHVSVGGALVPLDTAGEDMFDETFIGYTDASGNTEGWDGVFTIAVTDMSGSKFPVKLNTLNHSRESANVVVSLLETLIDPKYKTAKGDTSGIVQNSKLADVRPDVYEWLKSNIPTMFEVYGDNITVGQALSDMVYYGDNTINSFGHLSVKSGLIFIGGEFNPNYRTKAGKPLPFSYEDLQDGELRNRLAEFIERVKPFNVSASKLKGEKGIDKLAYRNHVFGNYMETSVNLNDAFTKATGPNPTGDATRRYERAHLYISALPIDQTAQRGTITEPVSSEQPFPPAPPEDLFVPEEVQTIKSTTQTEQEIRNRYKPSPGFLNNFIATNVTPIKRGTVKREISVNETGEKQVIIEIDAVDLGTIKGFEWFMHKDKEGYYQVSEKSSGLGAFNSSKKGIKKQKDVKAAFEEFIETISDLENKINSINSALKQRNAELAALQSASGTTKEPVTKVQTSSSIKPLQTTPEVTNLQETKEAETMKQKVEEKLDECKIPGGKGGDKPKPSLASALNKNRKRK
jgi:hypothetical protein